MHGSKLAGSSAEEWNRCVCVGHYCNRSTYFIYPGRDGWSAPSGHTHTSTYMAITSHGRVSWVVSQQQEGSSNDDYMCVRLCGHDSVRISHLCHCLNFSLFLFSWRIFFSFLAVFPFPLFSFSSISLPLSSAAASEIHESVIFPWRLQGKMKKAMVSSTTVQTCSRHPVPEEMMVVMVCVCVCVCVCGRMIQRPQTHLHVIFLHWLRTGTGWWGEELRSVWGERRGVSQAEALDSRAPVWSSSNT